MAAGLGTRLRPFTDDVPKPLLPIMDVPCIDFSLQSLLLAGVERAVANSHHLPDLLNEHLGKKSREMKMDLRISDESHQLLGSAGGIRNALSFFETAPFFLLNADVLSSVPLDSLARAHGRAKSAFGAKITLALIRSSPRSPGYSEVFFDSRTGRVSGLGKKKPGGFFYCGSAVLEPEVIAHLKPGEPADFVRDVLNPSIKRGEVAAFPGDAVWMDMGSPRLWQESHFELMGRLETGDLPKGWRLAVENANRRKSADVWVSNSVSEREIQAIEFRGPSYLSKTGQKMRVERVCLGPDAVVYAGAELKQDAQGCVIFGERRVDLASLTRRSCPN